MREILKKIDAPAAVAGAAFFASAGHIVSVVHETNFLIFALAYPVGIDGLLYVGMKALKERRFFVGVIALVVGTFFSLAFNGHAEGAFTLPREVIAFSMPICLLAAFVIEHIKKTPAAAKEVEIRTVTVYPTFLPIVPLPIKVEAEVQKDEQKAVDGPDEKKAITSGRTDGRTAAWDVDKAVRLLVDGRTVDEVATEVGTNYKAIQRTKKAVTMIQMDPSLTPDAVATVMNRAISPAHIGRIKVALADIKIGRNA